MYAWAVDEAASRLRELRHEEWGDLGLAALALGLSVAAAELRPALALPLFAGGLAVGFLGVRALWRRWDLVDRLAGERDAYVIPDVLAYAAREATMDRRRSFAAMLRVSERLPDEVEALACELEDETLELDPACAIACSRLVNDVAVSPLLNHRLPPEDLRSRVVQIRAGLTPREPAV